MRKVSALPLALAMSVSMLIVLVMGGNGLKTAHALPSEAARALVQFDAQLRAVCAPQHAVCGQFMAGAGGTLLVIAAARSKDAQALFAAAPVTAATSTTAEQAARAEPVVATALATALRASEALALLALCAQICGLNALRRFAAFRLVGAFPLALRQITEHRIVPAP